MAENFKTDLKGQPSRFTDKYFSEQQEKAKAAKKLVQGEIRRPAPYSPGMRERVQSALMGLGQGYAAAQPAIQRGDPLGAGIAAFTGTAGAPSPEALLNARLKEEQEALTAQLDSLPVEQVSPGLVEAYPELKGLPLSYVQKISPLLQKSKALEDKLALLEAREGYASGRFERQQRTRERAEDRRLITGLQRDYRKAQKDMFERQSGALRFQEVSRMPPSAARDMAIVFQFQKVNDPESVVRESEFETTRQARAWLSKADDQGFRVPSWIRQTINRADTGDFLLPEQISQFNDTVRAMYRGGLQNARLINDEFVERSEDLGVDPDRVVQEIRDIYGEETPSSRGGGLPKPSFSAESEAPASQDVSGATVLRFRTPQEVKEAYRQGILTKEQATMEIRALVGE